MTGCIFDAGKEGNGDSRLELPPGFRLGGTKMSYKVFLPPRDCRSASWAAILACASFALAFGQTENVLYRFQGASDGSSPSAALVADRAGNLYGTTAYGGGTNCNFYGSMGCGVVFQLAPQVGGGRIETVLYRFQGGADGASPGGVTLDGEGNLYGTTVAGGTGPDCFVNMTGCGTVFKLTRPTVPGSAWTQTVLYSFQSGSDGAVPTGLVAGKDGHLYGVTTQGGSHMWGTVFKVTRPSAPGSPWTKTVLYNFKGIPPGGAFGDGATPISLTFDELGNLYGTTSWGGIYSGGEGGGAWGTVFELTPPSQPGGNWNYIVLHRFTDYLQNPVSGVVIDKSGMVYGTTYTAVFELIPGTAIPIHLFTGGSDGTYPYGGVILDGVGNLYGTCIGGGQSSRGIVYKLTRPARTGQAWVETILHDFTGSPDGDSPDAPLFLGYNGVLYGTTLRGGNQGCQLSGGEIGCGTVFNIVP